MDTHTPFLFEAVPDVLREHASELIMALATPIYGAWPGDATYTNAEQPAAIGAVLVEAIHSHLDGATIGYVFREDMKKLDKIKLGSAQKVGGKLAFFSGLDFLIEVNWKGWMQLTGPQRVALIDHELSHCGVEEDDEGNTKYVLLTHDVEEFGGIVQRWGLWKPDLAAFARVCTQRDLFEAAHA